MKLSHYHAAPLFPPLGEPSWAARVERWYQLDPFAYVLAAAFAEMRIPSRPHSQLLACPGASNQTDAAFVRSGATSPAKFVHTLPNSRASSLLAVMDWAGPLLTLQRDPFTLGFAFLEALDRAEEGEECWVWTVTEGYKVDLFVFGSELACATHELVRVPAQAAAAPSCANGIAGAHAPSCTSAIAGALPQSMAILRSFWDSEANFDFENWVVRRQ